MRLRKESGDFVNAPLVSLASSDRQYVKDSLRSDPAAKVILGKVIGVTDGDTITVLDEDKQQHKIRLEGIDAPEAGQDFGSAAKRALSDKVFGTFLRTEWRDTDKYGRTLGHVYLDSRHINLELVAEGYAWHFKEYSSDPQLARAENVARQQRLGLWADSSPVAPWEFRHPPAPARVAAQPRAPPPQQAATPQSQPQTQGVTVYITKTGSKYHAAGCRYLAKSAIPISLADAQRRYGACSVCNPR